MTTLQKRWLIATTFLAAGLTVAAQAPVNNPYTQIYPAKHHWTEKMAWKKTTDASSVPKLVDVNNVVDSATLSNTMLAMQQQQGGGVLYFGLGTYYFSTDLPLVDGVVLRGAEGAAPSAAPVTHFVFPLLILKRGRRLDKEKFVTYVPKLVYTTGDADRIGLVNLDIDRAVLALDGRTMLAAGTAPHHINNLLLLGVQNNNCALLDPSIPTKDQLSLGQPWLIWPAKDGANINAQVNEHVAIAHCRINDNPTDSILQHDFISDDGMKYDGSEARFHFADHPGISINTVASTDEIKDNEINVGKGMDPVLINAVAWNSPSNHTGIVPQNENMILAGHLSGLQGYDLLFKDGYPSELKYYYSTHGDTLPYRLIKPANYDPSKTYPLVVYLHDFWDKGNDGKVHLRQFIWQLLTEENRTKYPCFIIAPQLPVEEPKWKPDGGLGSETWPLQATAAIIDREASSYSIDRTRVYAIGHSMGGAGVIHFATHYPELLAAVVPISAFYKFTPNAALQLARVPCWYIYGALDDKVSANIRQAIRVDMRNAHANYKYTDIPGKAHRCWNTLTTTVPDLLPWMFSQQQKTTLASAAVTH